MFVFVIPAKAGIQCLHDYCSASKFLFPWCSPNDGRAELAAPRAKTCGACSAARLLGCCAARHLAMVRHLLRRRPSMACCLRIAASPTAHDLAALARRHQVETPLEIVDPELVGQHFLQRETGQ